jgi:hypothetical protein
MAIAIAVGGLLVALLAVVATDPAAGQAGKKGLTKKTYSGKPSGALDRRDYPKAFAKTSVKLNRAGRIVRLDWARFRNVPAFCDATDGEGEEAEQKRLDQNLNFTKGAKVTTIKLFAKRIPAIEGAVQDDFEVNARFGKTFQWMDISIFKEWESPYYVPNSGEREEGVNNGKCRVAMEFHVRPKSGGKKKGKARN